ncbi:hypothetical protein GCM10027423_20670 [Spirosoma arcticum]
MVAGEYAQPNGLCVKEWASLAFSSGSAGRFVIVPLVEADGDAKVPGHFPGQPPD